MSKAVRKQFLQTINILKEAANVVAELSQRGVCDDIPAILMDCQELAIAFGTQIEAIRGMGTKTVGELEVLCEQLYLVSEAINESDVMKTCEAGIALVEQMETVECAFLEEFRDKQEIVFFPYKAAMWDSLESIWEAANADEDCEVYVVPIPYFDRNPDGTIKEKHYEADLFPDYVKITSYQDYNMALHQPDVAYIHNPYDELNRVTAVAPEYYSYNIKEYANRLVYVPYYATAGNMSDAQSLLSAYVYADYIVVQSEGMIGFFDERIPREKFLPFGSPKFDKVLKLCQNPPEPPEEWKAKMAGKTVYFYNTSLGGMLGNTPVFLKKMQYVFDSFRGREDACILWRPHPLLESTFESMQPEYLAEFRAIREQFISEDLGIYDDTPDMEKTIALSDVYIGDAGTSVISMFGVAGKPLFILDNYIDQLPTEKDKKDNILPWPQFDLYENERYQITPDNKLWISENDDHHYRYYMDLGEGFCGGGYYACVIENGDELIVVPQNAQEILIVRDKQIVERIELKDRISKAGAFSGSYYNKEYLFILPFRYPNLVRLDLMTHKVDYLAGIGEFRVADGGDEWFIGGVTFYNDELVVASPVENKLLFVNMHSLESRCVELGLNGSSGFQGITPYGDELWLRPMKGLAIACYDVRTGALAEYTQLPTGFMCKKYPKDTICDERPFGMVLKYKNDEMEKIILAPFWGNMFVELDRTTGNMVEWKPERELNYRGENCYHMVGTVGGMCYYCPPRNDGEYRFWYFTNRELMKINILTGECEELTLDFSLEDQLKNIPGFCKSSEWLQYACFEDAYNSLKDLLDDTITGNSFDKEKAVLAFSRINASTQGECGKRVHSFMKEV